MTRPTAIATGMRPPPMMRPIKLPTVPMTASPNTISSHLCRGMVSAVMTSTLTSAYFPDVATIGPKSISTPGPAMMEMPQALAAGSCWWIRLKSS